MTAAVADVDNTPYQRPAAGQAPPFHFGRAATRRCGAPQDEILVIIGVVGAGGVLLGTGGRGYGDGRVGEIGGRDGRSPKHECGAMG